MIARFENTVNVSADAEDPEVEYTFKKGVGWVAGYKRKFAPPVYITRDGVLRWTVTMPAAIHTVTVTGTVTF